MRDINGKVLRVGSRVVTIDGCLDYFKVGAIGKVVGITEVFVRIDFKEGGFKTTCNDSVWSSLPERLVRI